MPAPTEHPNVLKARISFQVEVNSQLDGFGVKIPFMTEATAHHLLSELVPEYLSVAPAAAISTGG